ncbi:MAG TPA: DUF6607 family protein [Polyangia bacterium]
MTPAVKTGIRRDLPREGRRPPLRMRWQGHAGGACVVAVLVAGCASTETSTKAAAAPDAAFVPACDPERDRRAILAMAGSYEVRFDFQETEALVPGYQLKKPYRVAATELVVVVEDQPRQVVLQHLLAVTDEGKTEVVKHWRQDWRFEDATLLEYRGGDQWAKRTLAPAEVRCAWSQAVFEINDGPRYEGVGRFVHTAERATWTSNPTWRPLPRRERKREDYDVIVAVNRHIMTATGWVHEQDNTKTVLRGKPASLVREKGINSYLRGEAPTLAAAQAYWDEHAPFWQDVRAAWARIIDGRDDLRFRKLPGARSLFDELSEVRTVAAGDNRRARAEAVLLRHLETPMAGPTAGR